MWQVYPYRAAPGEKKCSTFDVRQKRGAPAAGAPANGKRAFALSPFQSGKRFFVCEGRFFKLDLIGDSVHREVPALCKGKIVFRPPLTDVFSTELFKDFAFVVVAFYNRLFEVFFGADQLRAVGEKENFLFIRGVEAESASSTAGRRVKSEDVGENFACCDYRVHVLFEDEAEDVVVSEGEVVVAVDKVVKEGGVRHFWSSFLYSLLLSGTIIHPPDAFVNPFFKKILGFFADLQFVHNSIS